MNKFPNIRDDIKVDRTNNVNEIHVSKLILEINIHTFFVLHLRLTSINEHNLFIHMRCDVELLTEKLQRLDYLHSIRFTF